MVESGFLTSGLPFFISYHVLFLNFQNFSVEDTGYWFHFFLLRSCSKVQHKRTGKGPFCVYNVLIAFAILH